MKSTKVQLVFQCPECNEELRTSPVKYFTIDCNKCGTLLLVSDNQCFNFHEKMHEETPSWPSDGKNTGFVET